MGIYGRLSKFKGMKTNEVLMRKIGTNLGQNYRVKSKSFADEMVDSRWYKQVTNRISQRLVDRMRQV